MFKKTDEACSLTQADRKRQRSQSDTRLQIYDASKSATAQFSRLRKYSVLIQHQILTNNAC